MQNSKKLFVAVDVETTGIEPGSRMIELGAVLFNEDETLGKFEQFVNPGMPLPEDARKINGITNEMLTDKPDAATVLREFFDWLCCDKLVAHYAKYDTGIISWEAGRCGIEIPEGLTVIDTCEIAKAIGETKNNKLVTLADHYALERQGEDHRALADTHLCAEYFRLMHSRINPFLRQLPWGMAGHDYCYTDDFPEQLSILPGLVEKAQPLTFSYKNAKDEVTERTITPYGHALTSSGLMFHGWCHMREARRTFRADKVIEVI